MKLSFAMFVIFLFTTGVLASHTESCLLHTEIKSISQAEQVKEKKYYYEISFLILKTEIPAGEVENYCQEWIHKVRIESIAFDKKMSLKPGQKIKIIYHLTASEIVKNGFAIGMRESITWNYIE